jgi:transcriptional regulator with XRE-family HTH domain
MIQNPTRTIMAVKPLTLLKAYRVAQNLDTAKICLRADISRPYLTRLEQGSIPSPDIAERLVKVLRDADLVRDSSRPSENPQKIELLDAARRLIDAVRTRDAEFAEHGVREIHLLYPDRYQSEEEVGV